MPMNVLNMLKAAAVVQFLAMAVFLVTCPRGNRTANRLLAFFLTARAVCWGINIVADDWNFIASHASLQAVSLGTTLLLGPSLYLYARKLMYRDFRLKPVHALHALPFVLTVAPLTALLRFSPGAGMRLLFSNSPASLALYSFSYLQFVAYSAACLLDLRTYEKRLKSAYSSIDSMKMSWLSFLISTFIVLWLISHFNYLAQAFHAKPVMPLEAVIVAAFVVANAIVIKGLGQPHLFAGIPEEPEESKYAKTPLSGEKKEACLNAVLSCMKDEKPYLDPSMTLEHLSRKTAIPAHHISQVLNSELGRNFFDFVNGYRVEESKVRLRNDAGHTVLQVLFDSGFNSKASFHRAFKKHTGMTASQFKNSV
jgi:AraC-like DNA-binding protein